MLLFSSQVLIFSIFFIESGACIGVLFLPIQLDVVSVEFFLGWLIACAVGSGCHVWIAGGIF